MMRKYTSILVLSLLVTSYCFSQQLGFRKDNILLPEKLIISEQVGFDSLYTYQRDSIQHGFPKKPFFEMTKYIDFLRIIADRVIKAKVTVYDAWLSEENYPYSAMAPDKMLSDSIVKLNLGQRVDTVRRINEDGTINVLTSQSIFDPLEISSANFIEEWILTEQPLAFRKVVYAIEPVRKYLNPRSDYEEYRYSKPFRLYNPPIGKEKSNLKLAARVSYEHFFKVDVAYRDDKFYSLVEKVLYPDDQNYDYDLLSSNINSPFFNGFNQSLLVKTLLNNVYVGKVIAQDFFSSKKLTPQEAKEKIFAKQIVKIVNFDTGEFEDRYVENDLTSEIVSVIFIEEWYFDEISLQFEKKVVGIAPVRYYSEWVNNSNIIKREILFTIVMN